MGFARVASIWSRYAGIGCLNHIVYEGSALVSSIRDDHGILAGYHTFQVHLWWSLYEHRPGRQRRHRLRLQPVHAPLQQRCNTDDTRKTRQQECRTLPGKAHSGTIRSSRLARSRTSRIEQGKFEILLSPQARSQVPATGGRAING